MINGSIFTFENLCVRCFGMVSVSTVIQDVETTSQRLELNCRV